MRILPSRLVVWILALPMTILYLAVMLLVILLLSILSGMLPSLPWPVQKFLSNPWFDLIALIVVIGAAYLVGEWQHSRRWKHLKRTKEVHHE